MAKGQFSAPIIFSLIFVILAVFGFISFFNPIDYEAPPNFKVKPIGEPYRMLLATIGVPTDWLFIPGIIYLFVVPLLGVIVIVYGFLDNMQIFPTTNVNLILSIIIGFSILPLGIFTRMVSMLFAFMGVYSTGAFALLFIFGIIYVVNKQLGGWGFGRTEAQTLSIQESYNELLGFLRECIARNQTLAATNMPIARELKKIANQITNAENEAQFRNMAQAVRTLHRAALEATREITRHGGSVPRRAPGT